jgi:hypothetical protein
MKNFKSVIAAAMLASASLGSGAAMAVGVTIPSQEVVLAGSSAFFGNFFDEDQMGNSFDDHFTFSVAGGIPSNFDAIVSSISRTADTGLDVNALNLFTASGTQVATGTSLNTGAIDVWTLKAGSLAAGDYYVQVAGTMVSNSSGAFGGALMLAPVPEPATYGMMLAGLGLIGFMARRRDSK